MFHERIYPVSLFLLKIFNTPLVWYVPYAFFTLIIFVLLIKPFYNLSFKAKYLIGLSGLIYITGAIGLEHVGNNCEQLKLFDCGQIIINLIISLEEVLEMFAISIFNFVLLSQFDMDHRLALSAVQSRKTS